MDRHEARDKRATGSTSLFAREEVAAYASDGFVLRDEMFGAEELWSIAAHYLELRRDGRGANSDPDVDPTAAWPRIMHPHHVDVATRRLLLDARMMGAAEVLLGEPALALQTMWYWKTPGTLGQALHQDDFYVQSGGPLVAAWLAVDAADEDNGGLVVVPGSHKTPLQAPHAADPAVSFSRHEVEIPQGLRASLVRMSAGDVLYFDGRLIHGSAPNTSASRFRRTFIAHYIPATATTCAAGYAPLYDADGRGVTLPEPAIGTD